MAEGATINKRTVVGFIVTLIDADNQPEFGLFATRIAAERFCELLAASPLADGNDYCIGEIYDPSDVVERIKNAHATYVDERRRSRAASRRPRSHRAVRDR